MKTVLKLKWPITIGLIILTVVLFLLAPNLTQQAEKAGSFQLSDEASSQQAADILADAGASSQTISVVIPMDSELDEAAREMLAQMAADNLLAVYRGEKMPQEVG